MGLEPYFLSKLTQKKSGSVSRRGGVTSCIECGCCQSTCPADLPLLDCIRLGKQRVMGRIRAVPPRPKNRTEQNTMSMMKSIYVAPAPHVTVSGVDDDDHARRRHRADARAGRLGGGLRFGACWALRRCRWCRRGFEYLIQRFMLRGAADEPANPAGGDRRAAGLQPSGVDSVVDRRDRRFRGHRHRQDDLRRSGARTPSTPRWSGVSSC